MIISVSPLNLFVIENSFINYDYISNVFKNNPFAKMFVYILDDHVLGYLYYSDIYDRIEINNIEVISLYRNKGVGTHLMKKLVSLDKDITLEVREDNLSAISLYKKFSFYKVATRKGYYGDKDGILMERRK